LKISNKLVRATQPSRSRVREQLTRDVEKGVLYIVGVSRDNLVIAINSTIVINDNNSNGNSLSYGISIRYYQ